MGSRTMNCKFGTRWRKIKLMSRQICSWGALAWLPAQAAQSFHPTPPASPPRFAAQPCPALLWRCDLSYTAWPAPPSQHRAAQQPRQPSLAAKPALLTLATPCPSKVCQPPPLHASTCLTPKFTFALLCPVLPSYTSPSPSLPCPIPAIPCPTTACLLCLAQPYIPTRSCPFHLPHSLGFSFL